MTPPSGAAAGSIPACAGEASAHALATYFTTVYPRVCGGSTIPKRLVTLVLGLSPRVRGKRALDA